MHDRMALRERCAAVFPAPAIDAVVPAVPAAAYYIYGAIRVSRHFRRLYLERAEIWMMIRLKDADLMTFVIKSVSKWQPYYLQRL